MTVLALSVDTHKIFTTTESKITMVRRPDRLKVMTVIAATIAMLLGSVTASPTNAAPLYDNTQLGSFFKVSQSRLNSLPNGTLIRARAVSNIVAPGSQVFQYVFKTTNSHGKAVLASAAVIRPLLARPNANVLVYNDFINSLGVKCQPSFSFDASADWITTGGKTPHADTKHEYMSRNAIIYQVGALAAAYGIVTIFPDFLGLQSAYGANIQGGHITLDATKAALQMKNLNISKSKIVVSGYSGGAMVAGYAASMAPAYAPKLNIVGLAIGGVPVDMVWMIKALGNDPNPGFGIVMAGMIGMEREYPARMNVYSRLSPAGKKLVDANRNACTPRLLNAMANQSGDTMFTNVKLRKQHRELQVSAENSLINYRATPRVPIFIWSSSLDILVPLNLIKKLTTRWCATNRNLKIQLLDTHVSDHVTNAAVGSWFAFPWVLSRFAGLPPQNTEC